jgi:hypothetical protein
MMATKETTMTTTERIEPTETTTAAPTPLGDALRAAIAAEDAADAIWLGIPDGAPGEDDARARAKAAEAAVAEARDALAASDEPRSWDLYEEGYLYDTITASSLAEAMDRARAGVDGDNYPDREDTYWVRVRVECPETGEVDSDGVRLDIDEPECVAGEDHDWRSPHRIVGGIEENPGVWSHGGGIIMEQVCMRCGCARTTDTWAQDPETGAQGLPSVRYEPGKYASEIRGDE